MKTERIREKRDSITVERWFNGELHQEHVALTDPFGKQHLLTLSLAPEAADPDQEIAQTVAAMEKDYQFIRQRAQERGHLQEDCGCGEASKLSGGEPRLSNAPGGRKRGAKKLSAD